MTASKPGRLPPATYREGTSPSLLIAVGALLVIAGVVWALQGLGYIGGSVMSGVTFWAVAGPLIALAGLGLAVLGLRRRSAS